jgi:hypothetical protein
MFARVQVGALTVSRSLVLQAAGYSSLSQHLPPEVYPDEPLQHKDAQPGSTPATVDAQIWRFRLFGAGSGNRPRSMKLSVQANLQSWKTLRPVDLLSHLAPLPVRWWIAGGWALDLFIGNQTRTHGDLDIGILRRDVQTVLLHLSSWEIFAAHDGRLAKISGGEPPHASVNSLWCRDGADTAWSFQLLLDDAEQDDWVYRRDRTVRRALSVAIRRDRRGVPYLAPEIQLLYKSKHTRARDQMDFNQVGPRLDSNARAWLRDALMRTDPHHEWLPGCSGPGNDRTARAPSA